MFNDSFYDETEICRHGLTIDLINKKQILFVPVLRTKNISEAAVIYDYPMETEEIGSIVFKFFEQMRLRNLTLHTPYKNYWLMPKGIRSFKGYVKATLSVGLEWDNPFHRRNWANIFYSNSIILKKSGSVYDWKCS